VTRRVRAVQSFFDLGGRDHLTEREMVQTMLSLGESNEEARSEAAEMCGDSGRFDMEDVDKLLRHLTYSLDVHERAQIRKFDRALKEHLLRPHPIANATTAKAAAPVSPTPSPAKATPPPLTVSTTTSSPAKATPATSTPPSVSTGTTAKTATPIKANGITATASSSSSSLETKSSSVLPLHQHHIYAIASSESLQSVFGAWTGRALSQLRRQPGFVSARLLARGGGRLIAETVWASKDDASLPTTAAAIKQANDEWLGIKGVTVTRRDARDITVSPSAPTPESI
jgi:hypothetical protein